MSLYRISRNLEASIIDFITAQTLASGWVVNVEKSYARVYELDASTATICVRLGDTVHDKAEIGTNSTVRTPQIFIDLFCTNDGQRLDLKDFLISELKSGLTYYEYTIIGGAVDTKTQNGRIRVLNIADTLVNSEIERSNLDIHDRYRHLITLDISLGKTEV